MTGVGIGKIAAPPEDERAVERLTRAIADIRSELAKVIVGQSRVIEEILTVLFSGGHALIVGVPGLAKTMLVQNLARALDLSFNRIQFTPDLMPSDITGSEILQSDPETGARSFKFVKGPVFHNIVLADEINRTPPKTQAALLQAMQEHRVTSGGETFPIEEPFFVLATQNPIEQEGTYPLPEAQLDRFMFEIAIGYPDRAEEVEIVRKTTGSLGGFPEPVIGREDFLSLHRLVRRVPAADHVVDFAVDLARLSRPGDPGAPDFVRDWVSWGAGPRASQYLVLGAKARALIQGRFTPTVEDIKAAALPVLRHRIIVNFNADAEGVNAAQVAERLVDEVARRLA